MGFRIDNRIVVLTPVALWFIIMMLLGVPFKHILLFLGLATGLFLLPGIAAIRLVSRKSDTVSFWIAGVLGMAITTNLYAMARWWNLVTFFWIIAASSALYGLWELFKLSLRSEKRADLETLLSPDDLRVWGIAWTTLVVIGSAIVFSGRIENEGLVYYGHLGRDPIFHLALIGQLKHAVPPANFIVSGYPFSYHFLPDLAQAMLLDASGYSIGLHDMYYRLYPSFIYLSLGAVLAVVCLKLFGSLSKAVFAAVLIMGGADFSFLIGGAQTLLHFGNWSELLERAFQPWGIWSGVGGVIPLVHRPAYYHGMLMLFAGMAVLVDKLSDRRYWILAGILWGLMAGFNFTLSGVIGLSLVIMLILPYGKLTVSRRNFMLCSFALFIASIPFIFLLLTTITGGKGQFLVWSPGYYAAQVYGTALGRLIPEQFIPIASVVLIIIVTFGLKLAGIPEILRRRFLSDEKREIGIFLSLVFGINLFIALFFKWGPSDAVASNIVMFIQPTPWFLALLSIAPLWRLMKISRLGSVILWLFISLPIIQGLLALNLSYKTVIPFDELHALELIRNNAQPSDVIAFSPTSRQTLPILGSRGAVVHNFHVPALTGLRGFFGSESYSILNVSSSPGGVYDFDARKDLIQKVIQCEATEQTLTELVQNNVRWLLLSGHADCNLSGLISYWIKTDNIILIELAPDGTAYNPAQSHLLSPAQEIL